MLDLGGFLYAHACLGSARVGFGIEWGLGFVLDIQVSTRHGIFFGWLNIRGVYNAKILRTAMFEIGLIAMR